MPFRGRVISPRIFTEVHGKIKKLVKIQPTAEIAENAEGKKYNAYVVSGDLSERSLKPADNSFFSACPVKYRQISEADLSGALSAISACPTCPMKFLLPLFHRGEISVALISSGR